MARLRLRRALNRTVASLIPPIGTLITERNKLRAENSRLLGEADRLTSENAKLAARLSADETPSDIRDEFYSRGFAIMRNAIAPRRVDWFLAECLQPTAIFWSARSLTDADVTAMNSYYGVPWTPTTTIFAGAGTCSRIECCALRLMARTTFSSCFLSESGRQLPRCHRVHSLRR